MRYFIFYILIYLCIDELTFITCTDSVPDPTILKNFNISMASGSKFKQTCEYCSLNCNDTLNNNFAVQTVYNVRTKINTPVKEDIQAIIYYNCTNSDIEYDNEKTDNRFQSYCSNMFKTCVNTNCGHNFDYSYNKGQLPEFDIYVSLPYFYDKLTLKTKRCGPKRIIFNFKINNKSIDYRQESQNYTYTNDIFISNNLKKMPIILEIKEFPSTNLAKIRIHVNAHLACSIITKQYCPHLCGKNSRKCTMIVDGKPVEIENGYKTCPMRETGSTDSTRIGDDKNKTIGMCKYLQSQGKFPCQYICIDLPECRYMCVEKNKNKYSEFGYHEKVIITVQKPIGSGFWSIKDIPSNMVLANECEINPRLCNSYGSCFDKPVGYTCHYNDYNLDECKSLETSRFRHCSGFSKSGRKNINETMSFNVSISGINNFNEKTSFPKSMVDVYNLVLNISKNKDNLNEVFSETMSIMYKFSQKAKESMKQSYKKDSNISSLILKKIENVFKDISLHNLNASQKSFKKNEDYYETYAAYINENEPEHSIQLYNDDKEEDQFVKIKLNGITGRSGSGKLITNFIRYKKMDFMNEKSEVALSMLNRTKLIFVDDLSNNNNRKRYKNSDIIHLSLNQKRNVTIKFKLKILENLTSPSWLYSVDNECGYLEDDDEWEWSVKGCGKQYLPNGDYYCECNHLSNFAMLVAFKVVNENHLIILQYLSVFGGIVNILSLILFLIFVLVINSRDKLRLDQLNIAICLLLGTLVFLMGGLTSRNGSVCMIAAMFTQYLFLSAFVWKLILAINVVRMIAFMSYQNEDWMVKYRMIVLTIGYTVSMLIVIIIGSIYWKDYGFISTNVCWIDSGSYAFLSFLIPVGIILTVNLIILFFIANTLIRNYINTRKTKVNESNELLVFLQLMITMGLTWVPSYFATVYLAAMYFWVIFFPLQGLMMFLFVVVINRENREKVSVFVQRYSSLITKSTVSTEAKSHSKSKSSNSKSTEQNQSLLSETQKVKDSQDETFPMVAINDQNQHEGTQENNPKC